MKWLYIFVVAICLSLFQPFDVVAKRSTKQRSYTQLQFDKTTHDFGTILRERHKYNCVFKVENIGTEPLVIFKVLTSCSCLKAHYSRRPIMPGESIYIRVTIEAEKVQEGIFHRVIEIYSNAGKSLLSVQGTSVKKR